MRQGVLSSDRNQLDIDVRAEWVAQVPVVGPIVVGPINEHNQRYLAAKRDKMGHHLP